MSLVCASTTIPLPLLPLPLHPCHHLTQLPHQPPPQTPLYGGTSHQYLLFLLLLLLLLLLIQSSYIPPPPTFLLPPPPSPPPPPPLHSLTHLLDLILLGSQDPLKFHWTSGLWGRMLEGQPITQKRRKSGGSSRGVSSQHDEMKWLACWGFMPQR